MRHSLPTDGAQHDETTALSPQELQAKVRELQRLASNLSRAAEIAGQHEMTWVYALEGNQDGVWDWNAETNEVFFSERWKSMLGYADDEISPQLEEWDSRLHPDDREATYADLTAHLEGRTPYYVNEHRLRAKDGSYRWILDRGRVVSWTDDGKALRVVGTHTDITDRKQTDMENQRLLGELRQALENMKTLKGLIPICAHCKKIRNNEGIWQHLDAWLTSHSDAEFSHGICPDCRNNVLTTDTQG